MRVLLTTLNSKFIHTNLAIRYIREYSRDLCDIHLEEFTINNSLDYILKEIYKGGYDVVAFSVYIWNSIETMDLCKNLRKVAPEIKIILGGPEVSYDADILLRDNDFIDYILMGEGEITFRELLKALMGEGEFYDIKSLAFRDGNKIIINEQRELLKNLDLIPSPYENMDPEEYKNKIVYYESSRGCPFNCQYCLSSAIKGLRYFSMERVKSDLKALIDAGVAQIKFIDRTFNASKKKSMEVMRFLMENDNSFTTYHFEVTAHLIDDEMLEFLKDCKPGLFQFEIGVQTTNRAVLLEVGRTDDFEKLSRVVKTVRGYGNIHQHLDLIAGLPHEDMDSFIKSFNDVYSLGIEVVQLGFLKLIKGTGIREREESYGYEYRDYPPYEVLSSDKMSFDDLLRLKDVEEILETYYNSGNFKLSVAYVERNFFDSPFEFYDSFAKFFDERGYFKVSHGRNRLYEIFVEFFENIILENRKKLSSAAASEESGPEGLRPEEQGAEELGAEEREGIDIFKEIIKYDYYSTGGVSGSPTFINRVEIADVRNLTHKFLQDEYNIEKYMPEHIGEPAKKIIKHVDIIGFSYDIMPLKENPLAKIKRETITVLFNYDTDRIFDKSLTYRIEI